MSMTILRGKSAIQAGGLDQARCSSLADAVRSRGQREGGPKLHPRRRVQAGGRSCLGGLRDGLLGTSSAAEAPHQCGKWLLAPNQLCSGATNRGNLEENTLVSPGVLRHCHGRETGRFGELAQGVAEVGVHGLRRGQLLFAQAMPDGSGRR